MPTLEQLLSVALLAGVAVPVVSFPVADLSAGCSAGNGTSGLYPTGGTGTEARDVNDGLKKRTGSHPAAGSSGGSSSGVGGGGASAADGTAGVGTGDDNPTGGDDRLAEAAPAAPAHDPYAVPQQGSSPTEIAAWFNRHLSRGTAYRRLLAMTPNAATQALQNFPGIGSTHNGDSQSMFNTYGMLQDNGWVSEPSRIDGRGSHHGWTPVGIPIHPVFTAQGQCPVPQLMEKLGLSSDPQDNRMVISTRGNLQYTNIFNPSEGTIFSLGSITSQEPLTFAESNVSPLRLWSDTAFLTMRGFAGQGAVQNLRYIIHTRCNDPVSTAVVQKIVGGDPWHQSIPPSAGTVGSIGRYNVNIYNAICGPTLLSTPAGMRVVMLLAQHKDPATGLGMKRVKSIQILRDDRMSSRTDTAPYDGPTLVFEIEDVPADERIRLTKSSSKDTDLKRKKGDDDQGSGSRSKYQMLGSGADQAPSQAGIGAAKRDTIGGLKKRTAGHTGTGESGNGSSGGSGRVSSAALTAASAHLAQPGYGQYAVPA